MGGHRKDVLVGIEAKDKTGPGVRKAKRNIGGIRGAAKNALGAIVGPAGLAAGAIAAVGTAAFVAVNDFANRADVLAKLSQRTGVSAEELSKLQHAYDQAGLSSGDLERTLRRLTERMGQAADEEGPFAKNLDKLGLTFDALNKLAPEDQFAAIAEKISKLESVQERAAAASDLFGKKLGPDLLPLLEGGADGLEQLGEEAESLGIVITQETADIGAEFVDTADEIGKKFQGILNSVLEKALPIVTTLLKAFLSLLQGGGQMGEGLKRVWDFIVDVVKFAVNLYVGYIKDLVFNFVSLIQNGINTFLSILESGFNLGIGLFRAFAVGAASILDAIINAKIDFEQSLIDANPFDNRVLERSNIAGQIETGIKDVSFTRVDFLSNLETIGITGGHIESVLQGGLPVLDLSNLATPETNININVEGSVLSENDLATVVNRGRQLGTIR